MALLQHLDNLIINVLTTEQFNNIESKDPNQLYLITDEQPIGLATQSQAGLMSATDKANLDRVAAITVATPSTTGYMSAEDKTQLNSLAAITTATTGKAGYMSTTDKSRLDTINGNYNKQLAYNNYYHELSWTAKEQKTYTVTETKSGYTPILAMPRGTASWALQPIRFDWSSSNGSCDITYYIANTTDATVNKKNVYFSILWQKN